MVSLSCKGDYSKAGKWLKKLSEQKFFQVIQKYGQMGVDALAAATPKDTGLTAASWVYDIEYSDTGLSLNWSNTHVEDGWANIAILLQYGHGTGTGGYVVGRDYINPAMRPVFDAIAKSLWIEVSKI